MAEAILNRIGHHTSLHNSASVNPADDIDPKTRVLLSATGPVDSLRPKQLAFRSRGTRRAFKCQSADNGKTETIAMRLRITEFSAKRMVSGAVTHRHAAPFSKEN